MNLGKMMALSLALEEAAERKNTFDRIMAKKEKIEEMLEIDERVLFLEALELYAKMEIAKMKKIREIAKDTKDEEFDND